MKTDDGRCRGRHLAGLVLRPYAGEADLPGVVRHPERGVGGRRRAAALTAGRARPRGTATHPTSSTPAATSASPSSTAGRGVRSSRTGSTRTMGCASTARAARWTRRGADAGSVGASCLRPERSADERWRRRITTRPAALLHGMWLDERNVGAPRAGGVAPATTPARWFFDMERPSIDGDLPEILPLPGRPRGAARVARDRRASIWAADHEAFRDHWGGHDESEASFRRWTDVAGVRPRSVRRRLGRRRDRRRPC